jgi:3-oxoacyl-[acyl-carrier-protein] synthase-3
VPDKTLTNEQLKEKIPDIDPTWTYETLGIKERRVIQEEDLDEGMLDLAELAASRALNDAGIIASDLGLIIIGTTRASQIAPASACFLQDRIGASCTAFDMTSVCASFMHALLVATKFLDGPAVFASDYILIVGVDDLFSVQPYTSRNLVYFGAGAGAVVLTRETTRGLSCSGGYPIEIRGVNWGTDGSRATAWQMLSDDMWLMGGKTVYKLAVKWMTESTFMALKQAKLAPNDVDHVIPHQPSIQILKEVSRKLDIPFSKFHTHMDKYANTGAASVPLGLDIMNKSGKLKKGDIVVLSAVGAGWSWGTVVMEW